MLVGGHNMEDSKLKYGLYVTEFIHPDCILTNWSEQWPTLHLRREA